MILMKHCSFYLQSLIQSIFCLPREFCDVTNVYSELEKLLNVILPKKALHEYGVTEGQLPEFAKSVIAN